ncbi:MAG: hypothetical protein A2Y33_12760 [Spirochaetes bacterium GWF1_51_8]|nr:MAG: hypothetical protein A2Y33_12760 [Spirochaetes bacterium GWF1_51_8]
MDGLTLREMTGSDIGAVTALMTELGEFVHSDMKISAEKIRLAYDAMHGLGEIYFNLIAELNGRIAGFCSAVFYKTFLETGGTALINELVVSKAFRGTGIGRALVERTVSEALKRGMNEINVGTEKSNAGAQIFYTKTGFDVQYVLFGREFDDK